MTIIVKNKDTLIYDDFVFRCCVGKNGFIKKKIEGDKKTPIGIFSLDYIYYRSDKKNKPITKLKSLKIKKNMGWCDDPLDNKNYNKLVVIKKNTKCEKLYRKDQKYDLMIPIEYNYFRPIKYKGSCIFVHLTSDYKATAGCIAIKKKDFFILLKLINRKTKIKIC